MPWRAPSPGFATFFLCVMRGVTPRARSASLAAARLAGARKGPADDLVEISNSWPWLSSPCRQPATRKRQPAPPAAAPEAAAPKGPGLWRVGDADSTVYLFGTVHVLPPALEWRKPPIDKALGEAKAIYFETDLDPDPRTIVPVIQQLGMYPPSSRLSDRLTPAQNAALQKAAAELGLPAFQLDAMKPWLVAVTLSDVMITRAGYDVNSGVERKLAPTAKEGGKEIRKFETVEEQLLVFADLPEEAQIAFLMEGIDQIDESTAMLNELVNAWAAGDTAKLEKVMIDEDLAETPAIYDVLLVKRNANWAAQIDKLIKSETGTFFVAVGAAHLIGKDSVQEKLKPLGHAAERLE